MENNDKFKKMQDEMSRFEEEIGLPLPAPRVISATTYVEAQKQIVGDFLSMLPPPPPPLAFLQRPNIDAFIRAQPAVPTPAAINNPTIAPAMAPYIASVVSGFNPTPATPAKTPAPPPVPEREPSKPPAHAYLTSSTTGPMYPNLSADVKAMQEMHPAPISCDVPDPKKFRKRPLHPSELTYVNARENRRRDRKNKKLIRTAGGQCWEDPTLAEWEDDDFRLFCGDLGNDVTDEVLTRAFSKYHSFLKAKVVRDKRTNKTKGFGFVSFKDPQDFIRATKEMNGRYVGSRPIKLRKSTWKNRALDVVRKKEKEKAHLISMLTGKN